MNGALGRLVLAVSGLGFPMTQLAFRRLGRRGAMLTESVCLGLLIRDTALVAAGAPARLRSGPAALLRFEVAVAGVAAILGLRPILDRRALDAALAERPRGFEALRRASVGLLFGLHTLRFRIYLSPDRGRRPEPSS